MPEMSWAWTTVDEAARSAKAASGMRMMFSMMVSKIIGGRTSCNFTRNMQIVCINIIFHSEIISSV